MEVIIPGANPEGLLKIFEEINLPCLWKTTLEDGNTLLHILMESEQTEHISDVLTGYYADTPGCFHIIVLPVEVALPGPEPEPDETAVEVKEEQKKEIRVFSKRISRDELHADVSEGIELNSVYIITVVLSALVAAIGLMRDDVVIIIGAMVIAPLLGPNVALALASTLGDLKLAIRSLKTFFTGLVTAYIVALIIGYLFDVNTETSAIMSRTVLQKSDIFLALASGVAGALAYTTGVSTALIGVMVAVALLPPLVTSGLLLASGNPHQALGAIFLFLTNVTCVNIAGVITFLAQGIRPKTWWEAQKASKAVRLALVFWLIVLAILALTLIWWRY